MERSGANVRKRTKTTVVENERPRGPLIDTEITAVRRAHENSCRGEIIIGMRGEERVITMLVPETADTPAQDRLSRVREELRKMGCDGMYIVSQARGVSALQVPTC